MRLNTVDETKILGKLEEDLKKENCPILAYHLTTPQLNPKTPCGDPEPQVWEPLHRLSKVLF